MRTLDLTRFDIIIFSSLYLHGYYAIIYFMLCDAIWWLILAITFAHYYLTGYCNMDGLKYTIGEGYHHGTTFNNYHRDAIWWLI